MPGMPGIDHLVRVPPLQRWTWYFLVAQFQNARSWEGPSEAPGENEGQALPSRGKTGELARLRSTRGDGLAGQKLRLPQRAHYGLLQSPVARRRCRAADCADP